LFILTDRFWIFQNDRCPTHPRAHSVARIRCASYLTVYVYPTRVDIRLISECVRPMRITTTITIIIPAWETKKTIYSARERIAIYIYIFSARSYSFEDAITLIYIIIGLRRRWHRKIVKLNLMMLVVWCRFRATKQINIMSLIFNRPRRVHYVYVRDAKLNLVFSSSDA